MSRQARRHSRIPYTGPVMVSWEERGETRYARGRCIDVSPGGLRLEIPVPIAVAAHISLRAERIQISGSARVRHVARYGAKYLIGVELTEALTPKVVETLSDPQTLRSVLI